MTFRPSSGLLLDETYIYSHLETRPDTGVRATIFDNHIVRSRVNYQVNRELSFRAILDYNGVLANPLLVDLERTKHLTADLLMTYLVHPARRSTSATPTATTTWRSIPAAAAATSATRRRPPGGSSS